MAQRFSATSADTDAPTSKIQDAPPVFAGAVPLDIEDEALAACALSSAEQTSDDA